MCTWPFYHLCQSSALDNSLASTLILKFEYFRIKKKKKKQPKWLAWGWQNQHSSCVLLEPQVETRPKLFHSFGQIMMHILFKVKSGATPYEPYKYFLIFKKILINLTILEAKQALSPAVCNTDTNDNGNNFSLLAEFPT